MQDFTKEIKISIKQAMLPMLETLSPIKSADYKQQLISSLGFTRDQFGFVSGSNVSKLEKFISDEFWKLKQEGKTTQNGTTWLIANQSNIMIVEPTIEIEKPAVETQPMVSIQTQPKRHIIPMTFIEIEEVVNEAPVMVVETQPEPVMIEETTIETQPIIEIEEPSMVVKTQPIIEIEPTLVIETRSLIVEETREEKLLACDSFRNSLIENTACYGNYNKSDCTACLLSKWCVSYTEQVKAQRKEERQARQQAKTSIPE